MMPKAIGILLFIIEIGVFIGKPILREIQSWIKIRDKITFNKNTLFTMLLFVVELGGLYTHLIE